ncbi:MAG: PKD domain-containing protein [Candidatus Bipolaricaulota bacterium]|nr:PKD domain-containing protein [Candidatus Bipolaricaulota bacterium]
MRRLRWALTGVGFLAAVLALGGCDQLWPLEARIAILNSATGYAPLAVEFYDASVGPVSSRVWEFGDPGSGTGNTSTLPSPTHTYRENGIYSATLIVYAGDGQSSRTTIAITVANPAPVPQFEATPDHGPAPLAVTFDLSASFDPAAIVPTPTGGAIVSYSLDFGDGTQPATGTSIGTSIHHTYAIPGYRVATLTVVDNDGASASATHVVTVEGVAATLAAPGGDPIGLTYDGASLWVSDSTAKRIYKIRPSDGQVLASFDAPGGSVVIGAKTDAKAIIPGPTAGTPAGIAWNGGALWVACLSDGKIYEVNPSVPTTDPGHILAVLESAAFTPFALAFGGGALWVSDIGAGRIFKVDPLTGSVLGSIQAPGLAPTGLEPRNIVPVAPTGLAWASGSLWVSAGIMLYRVDPATGAILASVPAPGPTPAGLAFDGLYLWVADPNGTNPGRIDRIVVP